MNKIEFGDCRDTMRRWAADGVRVQTCVTDRKSTRLNSSHLCIAHAVLCLIRKICKIHVHESLWPL